MKIEIRIPEGMDVAGATQSLTGGNAADPILARVMDEVMTWIGIASSRRPRCRAIPSTRSRTTGSESSAR
jgi:hypothetical protein